MLFELAPDVDERILDQQYPPLEGAPNTSTAAAASPSFSSSLSTARFGFAPSGEWLNPEANKAATGTATSTSQSAGVTTVGALTVISALGTLGEADAAATLQQQERGILLKGSQKAQKAAIDKRTFEDLSRSEKETTGRRMFDDHPSAKVSGSRKTARGGTAEGGDDVPLIVDVSGGEAPTRKTAEEKGEKATKKSRPDRQAKLIEPKGAIDEKYRYDYQGRSFLRCTLRPNDRPATVPTRVRYAYKGHKGGIQALQWLPPLGQMVFAADMTGNVRLWDVLDHHQQIALYESHGEAITSLTVNSSGKQFSTASYDGSIRVWDTETAQCPTTLTCPEDTYCRVHKFHPQEAQSHFVLSGVDRKVLLWDLRTGTVAREYDRHLGSVLSLTFFDSSGSKFISTAEDKTIRTWDFNVPVQIQVFADPGMHAVPHVVAHPAEPSFVLQSLDNKAVIMHLSHRSNSLRIDKSRNFTGHLVSGTSCSLAFSKDGKYLSSGDMNGEMHIWEYKTSTKVKSFKAHGKQLVQHLWHPVEPSLVVTSSWDSTIKVWS